MPPKVAPANGKKAAPVKKVTKTSGAGRAKEKMRVQPTAAAAATVLAEETVQLQQPQGTEVTPRPASPQRKRAKGRDVGPSTPPRVPAREARTPGLGASTPRIERTRELLAATPAREVLAEPWPTDDAPLYSSRAEMLNALRKEIGVSSATPPRLALSNEQGMGRRADDTPPMNSGDQRRVEEESYVARLQENMERLRASQMRAEQHARMLERRLEAKDQDLLQQRRKLADGLGDDDQVITRCAELIAREVSQEATTPAKRRKAQQRMMALLSPEKCPAVQTAGKLAGALQSMSTWTD